MRGRSQPPTFRMRARRGYPHQAFEAAERKGELSHKVLATGGRRRRAVMPVMGGWMLMCGIGGILLIVLLVIVIAKLLNR